MSINITHWRYTAIQLEIDGSTLLIDPAFGGRHLWMPRSSQLPQTPPFKTPDLILITQSHYDHLDLGSFKYLPSDCSIMIPQNYSNYLKKLLPNPLIEMEFQKPVSIHGLKITALPLLYESFRLFGILYRNTQAYLIESQGKKILFIPDGKLSEETTSKLPDIDVLLAPLLPSRPLWLNRRYQMSIDEIVQLINRLKIKTFIPMNIGAKNGQGELKPNNESIGD